MSQSTQCLGSVVPLAMFNSYAQNPQTVQCQTPLQVFQSFQGGCIVCRRCAERDGQVPKSAESSLFILCAEGGG